MAIHHPFPTKNFGKGVRIEVA